MVTEPPLNARSRNIDRSTIGCSALALFALTYALIEGNVSGWTAPPILGAFAVAAVAGAAFLAIEARAEQDEPGQQAGVARVLAEPGEQDQADHHEQHPGRHRAVRPGPRLDPRRDAGEHR